MHTKTQLTDWNNFTINSEIFFISKVPDMAGIDANKIHDIFPSVEFIDNVSIMSRIQKKLFYEECQGIFLMMKIEWRKESISCWEARFKREKRISRFQVPAFLQREKFGRHARRIAGALSPLFFPYTASF